MSNCPSHDVTICELQALVNSRSPDGSWLRKFFLNLARVHFSSSGHYAHLEPLIGSMVWRGDESSTLAVELGEQMSPSVQSVSIPGISVNVGDVKFTGQVNNAHEHTDASGSSEINTVLASSMVTFACLHHASDASTNLASTLSGFMMGINRLVQASGLFGFQLEANIGPTRVTVAKEDHYQTLVVVSFKFNQRVSINTGGHLLRRITLDLKSA